MVLHAAPFPEFHEWYYIFCRKGLSAIEICKTSGLYANWKWLGAGVVGIYAGLPALETALKQTHQAGVPVAEHEEQEKRDGEIVLIDDCIPDGQRKIAADEKLDKGHDTKALAVAGVLDKAFGYRPPPIALHLQS